MDWEVLSPGVNRRSDILAVSIVKTGRVAWNKAVHDALGEPEFVELLYDRQSNALGLRRADKLAHGVFRVARQGQQQSWLIAALGPLSVAKLVPTETYRSEAKIDESGVVYINLTKD